MEFDKVTNEGEKYALLHPTVEQNGQLKKEAQEAGAEAAVKWSPQEKAYRLFEAKVPDGLDVDKTFGKWTDADQVAAAKAETEAHKATTNEIDKAAGISYEESKLYYPLKKDRKEFHDLAKANGTTIKYIAKAEAFVHQDGPTEGFEKWQTPEAKEAWKVEGAEMKAAREARRNDLENGVEVMKERANGNHFVADNAQGFMLPSTKEADARKVQLDALAGASKEEVAVVYKVTDAEKRKLDNKQFAVQINAAQKKDPNLTADAFKKMSKAERLEVAGTGLKQAEFGRLVALQNGFFAVRDRAIELGLVTTRQNAKNLQEDVKRQTPAASTKEKAASPAEKKPEGQSVAAAMLAAGNQAMGR